MLSVLTQISCVGVGHIQDLMSHQRSGGQLPLLHVLHCSLKVLVVFMKHTFKT